MENVSKSVNITKSDHVKAEVILEQGQCRHGVHTCLDTKGRYTDGVVTKNCHSSESISREGQKHKDRVPKRVFYNTSHSPAQIESLLVRPLSQNVNIFRANAQNVVARSYASVVKGSTKAPTNVQKYCKGGSSGLPNTP